MTEDRKYHNNSCSTQQKPSIRCFPRLSSALLGLPMLFCLLIIGCFTMPKVEAVKPVEYVLFVQADGLWQDSGAYARHGQLIQCSAEGEWGDRDGTYGPGGDRECYKDHLGVAAPAHALLMKLSSETNMAYLVGSETNIAAERSGYVLFRNNISLPRDAVGQLRVSVKVASDADQDGVSDYEEVYVWGLDPLNPDSDGDGFGDLEEVSEKKARVIDTSSDANMDRE